MEGTPIGGEIVWVLANSVVLVAVFGPLTTYLYRNKH